MKVLINAVVEELRRMKAEGVERVEVSEEGIELLKKVVGERTQNTGDRRQEDSSGAPVAARGTGGEEGRRVVVERRVEAPVAGVVEEKRESYGVAKVEVPAEGTKTERWEWLRKRVLEDEVCRKNVREGKQVVFGVGSLDAKIMFVGEAPGADEELQGEPFVGKAGQLLTRMIQGMGLKREDVYIGNIMNWRPQMPVESGVEQVGNRPPTAEEMGYCLPFLKAQVEVVQPEVLVALGKTAAEGLLGFGSFKSLGSVRGKWKEFDGKPVMVTYHPAYILRNGSMRTKREIWEDLMLVMERVGMAISEKQRGYFL